MGIFGDAPRGPNIGQMMYSYNKYLDRQGRYQRRAYNALMRNWRSALEGSQEAYRLMRGSQRGALSDAKDIFKRTEGGIMQRALSTGMASTTAPNAAFRDNAGQYARARSNILADYANRLAAGRMNIANIKSQKPGPYDRSWVPLTRMMIDQGLFTGGIKDEGSPGFMGRWGGLLGDAVNMFFPGMGAPLSESGWGAYGGYGQSRGLTDPMPPGGWAQGGFANMDGMFMGGMGGMGGMFGGLGGLFGGLFGGGGGFGGGPTGPSYPGGWW